ncbi:hypothetical protein Aduo_004744 [Ancylostoma duodenale]
MPTIWLIFSVVLTSYAKYDCETEWIAFEPTNSKYKRDCITSPSIGSKRLANFHQAESKCQEMNAHLVSIHSEEENEFVLKLIGIDGQYHTWIGLHRTEDRKGWRWTDDTPVDFTKWAPDQPDDGGTIYTALFNKEDCGHIYNVVGGRPLRTDKQWDDALCTWDGIFICKRRMIEMEKNAIPRGAMEKL